MPSKAEIRSMVLEEFQNLVIGPRDGDEEFITGRISLAYMAGILFPKGGKRSDLKTEGEDFSENESAAITTGGEEFSGDEENPLSMANEELPCSVGISFLVPKGAEFKVEVSAASYVAQKNDLGQAGYLRVPLKTESVSSNLLQSNESGEVLGGRARLILTERPSSYTEAGTIFTVSLLNIQEVKKNKKGLAVTRSQPEKWLFQTALTVKCEQGFAPYHTENAAFADLEDQILALQYADSPVFAVGHGASVDWAIPDNTSAPNEVKVAYLPAEFVRRPVFDRLVIDDHRTLELKVLWDIRRLAFSDGKHKTVWFEEAREFLIFFREWIDSQAALSAGEYADAASNLHTRMKRSADRMAAGLEFLEHNEECWDAFCLANRAMLLQMEQVVRLKDLRKDREQSGVDWPIPFEEKNDAYNGEPELFPEYLNPRWRPFQLAFFLLTVFGMENTESEDHDVVDLIWFSTGGGKTEAYLLLASYEMIRRRQRRPEDKENPGTAVITRYTLRFLTADQLARTASLMCAMEKMRKFSEIDLGEKPFRVGLYIGTEKNSYKDLAQAESALQELWSDTGAEHKFQISECPNCGTSLIPKQSLEDGGSEEAYGIHLFGGRIKYRCPSSQCFFFDHEIPVTVIDEEIYINPPDFLLGTIDKFAGVPFTERAGEIFGAARSKGVKRSPPSLIIQDELHLISGPLGTLASIYEAAFDTLIKQYQSHVGLPAVGAKYIASSATVRDSEKQIRRLMGRSAQIFPPRGMRSHDSFFAREDGRSEFARLYVGLMPQGVRATTAAHWASAALLQAVRYVGESKLSSREEIDFLWSLLCYCNSKRELGLINGAVAQEITERQKVYGGRQHFNDEFYEQLKKQEVSSEAVKDVSSTRSGLLVGVVARTDSSGASAAPKVVDFVPCTNMISVGVDIDRLGLMLVNGQPKTTAEYIQATSRVGRNPEGQGPGLVLTLYSPAKPRDRSHYEYFKNYHSSLYRLVEPNSVTPGSLRALQRAAHAAVVTVVRHGVEEMRSNDAAPLFNPSSRAIKEILEHLQTRLLNAYSADDEYERRVIQKKLREVVSEWEEWAAQDLQCYRPGGKNEPGLLRNAVQPAASDMGWLTMWSMRGVDVEVQGKVR